MTETVDTITPITLPILVEFCRKMEIPGIINKLVPSERTLRPGTAVLAMIVDTLCGRSPLVSVEDTYKDKDMLTIFGDPEFASHHLSDDHLGRALDDIYAASPQRLFEEIALNCCGIFNLDTSLRNADTTSRSVYGAYPKCPGTSTEVKEREKEGLPPKDDTILNLAHGHSKDKHPECKQFLYSLVCVEGSIPVIARTEAGNCSDNKANNIVLNRLNELSKEGKLENTGQEVFVADSRLVTPGNLETLKNRAFISRLPATYKEQERAILAATEEENWVYLGPVAEYRASRPPSSYEYSEQTVTLGEKVYRAVVFRSNNPDKRKRKKIIKAIEKSKNQAETAGKRAGSKEWATEEEAEAAMEEACKEEVKWNAFHAIEWKIERKEKYKRGRPKQGTEREVIGHKYKVVGTITTDKEKIAEYRKTEGCYVLLTNSIKEAGDMELSEEIRSKVIVSGAEVLTTYKKQLGVEINFRFMKDPALVNEIFLEKPERIESLGLILLLSLLVWSLLTRELRKDLGKNNGDDYEGWDKKRTVKPTARLLLWHLGKSSLVMIGEKMYWKGMLTIVQSRYLRGIGISPRVLTEPKKAEKWCLNPNSIWYEEDVMGGKKI